METVLQSKRIERRSCAIFAGDVVVDENKLSVFCDYRPKSKYTFVHNNTRVSGVVIVWPHKNNHIFEGNSAKYKVLTWNAFKIDGRFSSFRRANGRQQTGEKCDLNRVTLFFLLLWLEQIDHPQPLSSSTRRAISRFAYTRRKKPGDLNSFAVFTTSPPRYSRENIL